jgi:hypothetical protein
MRMLLLVGLGVLAGCTGRALPFEEGGIALPQGGPADLAHGGPDDPPTHPRPGDLGSPGSDQGLVDLATGASDLGTSSGDLRSPADLSPSPSDMATLAHAFAGSFTIEGAFHNINGKPASGALQPLVGRTFRLGFAFEIAAQTKQAAFASKDLVIQAARVAWTFSPADSLLTTKLAPQQAGKAVAFRLQAMSGLGTVLSGNLHVPETGETFAFELGVTTSGITLDAQGYPIYGPFEMQGPIIVRRYLTNPQGTTMTDFAWGTLTSGTGN